MSRNSIIIEERLEKGILGGPHKVSFSIIRENVNYTVIVEQYGVRQIKIVSDINRPLKDYLNLFDSLDMLLMLIDGKFIPISSIRQLLEDEEKESEEIIEWKNNRLNLFFSSDYNKGSYTKFMEYDSMLNADILEKWITLREELDIIHQMFLYMNSEIGVPVDIKCAFLIESFKALSELIRKYVPNFKLKKDPCLRDCIKEIIEAYGQDIFSIEYSKDKEAFVTVLINSRNRIAHIKSRQNKKYLNGPESVRYILKISFLYRRIILELIGVDYMKYKDKLIENVKTIDNWNGVIKQFLEKI